MAEAKKVADTKPASPAPAPAAESGDPAVHQLLAQRQTAQMNADDRELERVNAALADLGYE